MQVAERIGALEAELRRSKRREEKLAALQYRLREDLKQNQGDIRCITLCPSLCVLHRADLPQEASVRRSAASRPKSLVAQSSQDTPAWWCKQDGQG